MQKITLQTPNLTDKKVDEIAKIFPNVITEKEDDQGNTVKAVDFDLLRQELSKQIVEDDNERYRLDWPGKKRSLLKANTPIDKTLRPVREDSVNFDTTENLYIEGDNFEALKILQESYLGKVKMIYIDPPYNTGKDFVYRDNFKKSKAEYEEELDITDEEGGKLVKNTDTNGRFHSDWLSMMYERLLIARDLLKDDGVIFISIDDNEVHNLRKIADEVFGEENFISNIIWQKNYSPRNDAKHFSDMHDHILCYTKSSEIWERRLLPRTKEQNKRYTNRDNDPRGPWKAENLAAKRVTEKDIYTITTPSGREVLPPKGSSWRVSKEKFEKLVEDNRIWFGEDGSNVPARKSFLSEVQQGKVPTTIFFREEVGDNQEAANEIRALFDGEAFFDTPKPTRLINRLTYISNASNSDIILDFFAGSATTAHAVMQLNAEDGGNRKFIMVQIPEETDESSEAYKAGYKYITDIGKERIRRAAKKIQEDYKDELANRETPLDTGFRVFRVDSTNIEDVARHPSELAQESLIDLVDNVKPDRTPEDLLIEVMLQLGLTLDLRIVRKEIGYKTVFFVAENSLVACFDTDIDESLIDEIVKVEPLKVVFRDASFKDDKDRINLENRFKSLSPDTVVSVI